MTPTANAILDGLSFREYRQIRAVSCSRLKHLRTSPLHYRHACDHPVEPTPAMIVGSATHCLALERSRFNERFAVYGARRAGKEWEAFRDKNAGKDILSKSEYDRAKGMADAVLRHKHARRHLRDRVVERTVIWRDEETGIWCKGRTDALADRLIDVKTTAVWEPRMFVAHAYRLGYHLQLAMYHEGLRANGLDFPAPPVIIAVESKGPHDVACYEVTPELLEAGRDEHHELLRKLAHCEREDEWPGIAEGGELFLHAPPWADANADESDVYDLGLVG